MFRLKKIEVLLLFLACLCLSCVFDEKSKVDKITYISSGGIQNKKIRCPSCVNDVIVPLSSLSPPAKLGNPTMTMEGVRSFIKNNKILTITGFLNKLPIRYKTNFSLVEITKGEGESSIKYPRIVLFGSDGVFLMNISTKPNDPKYNLLDCAELNLETGNWEFSQLDFTNKKPKFHKNPTSCIRCHGNKPRPVWGTNMDWPGVFGDNEAAGPNGEAISYRHVLAMNEIKKKQSYSPRFEFLEWSDQKLTSGGIRRIANHAFGAELLVSNLAIGTATARGVFLRLKQTYPKRYKSLKEVFILLAYEHMVKGILSDSEIEYLNSKIAYFGVNKKGIDGLFKVLGIDTEEAFSLATLAKEEIPKKNWSLGAGDLYEHVFLQVLDDLMKENKAISQIIASVPNTPGVFGCENLGNNIKEIVEFKMLYLFYLRGHAKYKVHKVYYPQDIENIKQKVFIPLYDKLVPHLKKSINIIN